MKIQPMSEQEAKAASSMPPLPDGDYDCEITTAVEKVSQSSGMGMFEIDLRVYTAEGKTRQVRDFVMTEGKAAWRLRQCCAAFGMIESYESGEVSEHEMAGRTARVTLRTEPASGDYGPKNRVKTYQAPVAQAPARRAAPARQMAPAGGGDFDDDIPFAPEWR